MQDPQNLPPEEAPPTLSKFTAFSQAIAKVQAEMGKVLIGQQDLMDQLMAALLADGHVLIEGVPGVAKTMAAKLLAKSLDLKFSRIQFTPDLMSSDVLGTSVFNNQSGEFEFRQGPIFGQVVLIDEINRAPAKTQSALFEAMEERQITIDGITYPLADPFFVIATQNPIEQEGTYRLPEAQLDRFLFKIQVGYPNLEEEIEILERFQVRKNPRDLDDIQAVMMAEEILHYREMVRHLKVESDLLKYVAQLVQATRQSQEIYLGASPRASLNLLLGAKALAAMQGRDFTTPDDIKALASAVLHHRSIITPEREMEGATPSEVVKRLVEGIEIPR